MWRRHPCRFRGKPWLATPKVVQTFVRVCDPGNTLDDFEARVYRLAIAQASGNLAVAVRCIGLTRARLASRLRSRVECDCRPATASWMQLIAEG